ncbi:MAG TPA: NADH-quinone oxidoreductase subunit J [Thermoanaerobaculia bacterium]|nr:NADH-quinone oxidoreductase subunit J [Thermoanaerobaculia bacterium]
MEQALGSIPMVIFFLVGTVAVASSILVVAMRNPVHSALFLLLTFLCVAVIFILAHAEFVGAVQLLVYAGGIMVLFLFVVMLANIRELPDEKMLSPYWKGAIVVGAALFILFASVVRPGAFGESSDSTRRLRQVEVMRTAQVETPTGVETQRVRRLREVGNTEAIGMVLYQDYLIPFEVVSLFLLVAMIGAIVIGKRQLTAMEEETVPKFIQERAAEEKRQKEALGA